MTLRVLVVTNQYPTEEHPGDAPCIRDQVEALRELGVKVDVLLIDRFRSPMSYLDCALRLFGHNFRRRRYDIVHAFYGHAGLVSRCQFRVPLVLTYRGSDLLGGVDGAIGRAIAPLLGGVITMTEEMKLRSGRSDARVIPFGIDLERVRPQPRDEARRSLGLNLEAPLILFPYDPGRAVKRFDLISEMAEGLRKEFANLEIITVYDRPPEDVVGFMSACDVFVLASDYEGSPLAVREAMAVNLPIVSVAVGDVPELLDGVEASVIVPRQEVAALADAVRPLLRHRPRSSGRDRVAEFDADWSAREVLKLYEELRPVT